MLALITPGVQSNLYKFALNITKHPYGAEDILADTITKCVHRADVTRPGRFLAYLKVVLRNAAFDWVKRYKVRQKYLEGTRDMAARSAFAEAISKEALQFFDNSVARLNSRERRAVILRVVDGLGFKAIGRRMGTTENSARVLFFRAKLNLRSWFRYMRAP